MFYAIDIGHNAPPSDTGAIGINKEDELATQVGMKLDEILRSRGHKTIFVAPQKASSVNESLNYRCDRANRSGCDFFISIHLNAFNGKANGTEVYINSPKSKLAKEAKLVVDNIAAIGFANRGLKVFNWQVLRNTDMPGMLIECCFCDSDRDMQLFDADKIASAIASGLCGEQRMPTAIVDHKPDKVKLKVTTATLLKPFPLQSSAITEMIKKGECDREMQNIAIGEYDVLLLADEEGHFAIGYKGEDWFVYSGHCAIAEG